MSDPGAPDPMDKAYVDAEAVLDDAAARAARRAPVAGRRCERAGGPVQAAPATRRRRHGGPPAGWPRPVSRGWAC